MTHYAAGVEISNTEQNFYVRGNSTIYGRPME